MSWRPFFATGEIVHDKDYELLRAYWEELPPERREETVLSERDFEELRSRLPGRGERMGLEDLLRQLEEYFLPRVDADAAARAFRRVYGVEVPPEEARRRVARVLAGWLIEAGSQWGMLKLSGRLPRD